MDNEVFYVRSQNGTDKKTGSAIFDKSKSIPSKFLIVNGQPVIDPNPGGSTQVNIYSRLSSTGSVDEASISGNPHNYLIVPANYNPSESVNFAVEADIGMASATALSSPEAGAAVGLAAMTNAFWPGHEQDLQRGERWGIPQGETSATFRDAASWNLGYVTQMTPLPNAAAVVGGGVLNTGEYAKGLIELPFGGSFPKQKLNGPMGMPKADYRAFLAGIKSGRETEANSLEGKTPLEKLRYHATKARADAASQRVRKHMTLHHIATKRHPPTVSYAPTPGRQNGRPHQAAGGNAGSWSGSELARSSLALKMDALLQSRGVGGMEAGAAARANIAQGIAAMAAANAPQGGGAGAGVVSSSGFGLAATDSVQNAAWMSGALALRFQSRSPLSRPSMAPPISRGAGGGGRFQQNSAWVEGAPLPSRPGSVETSESLAPRAQDRAATASGTLVTDFTHSAATQEHDIGQALKDYFFRQSRLPPSGVTAFDPRLTPAWAGLKIPG